MNTSDYAGFHQCLCAMLREHVRAGGPSHLRIHYHANTELPLNAAKKRMGENIFMYKKQNHTLSALSADNTNGQSVPWLAQHLCR